MARAVTTVSINIYTSDGASVRHIAEKIIAKNGLMFLIAVQ